MNKKLFLFTKQWLSGFTLADGSFLVLFDKRKGGKLPYRPRPVFIISQSIRELDMMEALKAHLGAGTLQINRTRGDINLVISSLEDIMNIIIPHFDMYPVLGGKKMSYNIFRKVVYLMNDNKHKTLDGFLQILSLSYS